MVTLQEWHTIRHLAKTGKSQRYIAKTLGISRNTVGRVLASESLPEYERAAAVTQTLDALRPVVEPALERGIPGQRLLASVRQSGYVGSDATFYRWLRELRQDIARRGSSCRFETGPGEQAQFDWSPYTLRLGNSPVRVILYAQAQGYSRRVHWYPSLSERQDSVLEAIEEGWRHFGGCCRYLVVDNAKSMVLRHRCQELRWNECFLALLGHYCVGGIAATPAHPQTKGKVENPFRTIENRLLKGGEWRDFDHLVEEIALFEADWEKRIHATTRQSPAARFLEERDQLIPLPSSLFAGCPQHIRRLSGDGLFSYQGCRYCVPDHYPGRQVRTRTRQGRELIVLGMDGTELIRHLLNPPGSPPVFRPECYEANKRKRQASLAALTAEIRTRYAQAGEILERFLARLLPRHPNHPEAALGRVLDLLVAAPEPLALSVLAQATELGLPEPAAIEALLTRALKQAPPEPPTAHPGQHFLPALDVERPLDVYGRFLPPAQENGHGG